MPDPDGLVGKSGPDPERAPSDHSLLGRFRRGSEDAATQLYLRYADRLRALAQAQASPGLARRLDVEDIVQSVFGSFFRGASQGFYEVPVGEELWKLFLVIALNKIRARGAYHHAAKRDVRRTSGSDVLAHCTEELAAGDEGSLAILQMTIDEALEHLSPLHKEMVALRVEGYQVAEIAERTGRSKRTVERTLQEVRQKLAGLLETDVEPRG
jgi:RNA polymerase sigma-70 factor (ECF subfamily)